MIPPRQTRVWSGDPHFRRAEIRWQARCPRREQESPGFSCNVADRHGIICLPGSWEGTTQVVGGERGW
jgi:hypothetical protein